LKRAAPSVGSPVTDIEAQDNEAYKKIYISPDLTRKQQKVDKELRDKLKEIRKTHQFARINQYRIVVKESSGQLKVLFSLESESKTESGNVSKNDQSHRNLVSNK